MKDEDVVGRYEKKICFTLAKLFRFPDSFRTNCLQIVQVTALLQKSVIWANEFQMKAESPLCCFRL